MADKMFVLGLDDLAAYQRSAAADNFALNLSPAIGGAQFDMRTWSPEAQIGTSFAKAFLSAALGQIGRNQLADETKAVQAALPALYANPAAAAAPEGVDAAAFEDLRQSAMLKDLANDLFRRQADLDRENALEGEIGKEAAKGLIGGTSAQRAAAADILKRMGFGKLADMQQTAATPGGSMYEQALEMFDGNKELADAYVKANDPRFIPKTELAREKGAADAMDRVFSFIDDQYKDAAETGRASALAGRITSRLGIGPTEAASIRDRAAEAAILQFDNLLGREVNSDVRERLIKQFGPKDYDSAEMIDSKRDGLKKALAALAKGTPLTDMIKEGSATDGGSTKSGSLSSGGKVVTGPDGNLYEFID